MIKMKILGTGCKKCVKLYEQAKTAAEEMNIKYSIEKVTDINKIIDYGIITTPALVVNEDVKFAGKVPKIEEIKKVLV